VHQTLEFKKRPVPVILGFSVISMLSASVSARQARTRYRHELRTLTYVTLDEANGGIVRNLNHEGVAVQAVAPLRQEQRVRLRFELRFPRLRVEAHGQVTWANPTGQCGIRFIDLPARTGRQINEWIFSNLLDSVAHDANPSRPVFAPSGLFIAREENAREENVSEKSDGLILSASPRPAIRLDASCVAGNEERILLHHRDQDFSDLDFDPHPQNGWLSQPLSAGTVSWLVDGLVVLAGVLLFVLIFLSIAHELPPWPLALGAASGAAVFVAAVYWSLFVLWGRATLGARLAHAAASGEGERESEDAGSSARFSDSGTSS